MSAIQAHTEEEVKTRNIFVSGFGDEGEDVVVFTSKYTAEEVEERLTQKGAPFIEVYEIQDDELQYYCYEPIFLDEPTRIF